MARQKHHGWALPEVETLLTPASYVTYIRTVLSVALGIFALLNHDQVMLFIALACYWVGDIADGWVARQLKCETRSGALLDILADRLCVAVIYIAYATMHAEMTFPIGLYLLEFLWIDAFLSISFLFWPILSPNYFFLVDRKIFLLNWSLYAKAVNSSLFLLVTIFIGSPELSTLVALLVICIKVYSMIHLYRIGFPKHGP